MSTISSAPAAAQDTAGHSWASGLAAILKCWWVAFITWRIERAAIAQLQAMSQLELHDIGLIRSNITDAVRHQTACDNTFTRDTRWQ